MDPMATLRPTASLAAAEVETVAALLLPTGKMASKSTAMCRLQLTWTALAAVVAVAEATEAEAIATAVAVAVLPTQKPSLRKRADH